MDYSGKRVLVLGLGESGLALALWLVGCGAQCRVADTRSAPPRLAQLQQACPAVPFIACPEGGFSPALLDDADFVVDFIAVSPGLAPHGELARIEPAAKERGIPVWGEIEIFAQALAALRESQGYSPKVIAITGTNGKTTVTSMVGLLCARAGMSVQVAGNISPAALDVLRTMLAQNSLPQVWVLELSSFQLHTTYSLQADAATVLNLTQDHLDWHGSMEAYAADKARIFGRELGTELGTKTAQVLNRDDRWVMAMAKAGVAQLSFGLSEAQSPDAFGLQNERGVQWLSVAQAQEEGEKKRRRKSEVVPVEISMKRLMPTDALKIRGQHNALNALAALALCRAIGLPLAPLLHGLRDYAGEPHRVEWLQNIGGVDFYDDSKGTNVGATVAAINGLGAAFNSSEARIVLLAGGDGKGQDFSPLADPVARYVRAVCLIGRDAPALRTALAGTGVALHDCATLEQAVEQAAALAQAGDAVLLSPACASLDMFRNYAHRAEVFVSAVREWALQSGEIA